MTGEEATALGYRRISNSYRMVARIDRPDWLEVMARALLRVPADFVERSGPYTGQPTGGWCDHYRRCLSKDRVTLSPEEFKKVPGSGHDPCGFVPLTPSEVPDDHEA